MLRARIVDCQRCALASTRTHIVFGEGNPEQPLVAFLGEAPGAVEDETGRPFVGPSGQLLNKMIQAMHLAREQVYLLNVVACRPPDNRDPEPGEVRACAEFWRGQLRMVRPKVIVCLGAHAAQGLLGETKPVERLRGTWKSYEGIPVRVTYHPAFLLRPKGYSFKAEAWNDLQAVMRRVGLLENSGTPPSTS